MVHQYSFGVLGEFTCKGVLDDIARQWCRVTVLRQEDHQVLGSRSVCLHRVHEGAERLYGLSGFSGSEHALLAIRGEHSIFRRKVPAPRAAQREAPWRGRKRNGSLLAWYVLTGSSMGGFLVFRILHASDRHFTGISMVVDALY